jgi:hypothetical protein
MLRNILVTTVLSFGFFAPLALPAASEAHDFPVRSHHRHYHVYFRECVHDRWQVRTFHDRGDAYRVAHRLRHRGFEVIVR